MPAKRKEELPRKIIEKNIGHCAGIKGIAIAIMMGTAAAGPLYAAFPVAVMLLKKGASVFNIIIFLTVWAAAKIPMLVMETKFLGLSFALLRLVLTLTAAVLIGWLVARVTGNSYEDQAEQAPLSAKDGVISNG